MPWLDLESHSHKLKTTTKKNKIGLKLMALEAIGNSWLVLSGAPAC